MKRMSKALSILLTLALLLTLLPWTTTDARAADVNSASDFGTRTREDADDPDSCYYYRLGSNTYKLGKNIDISGYLLVPEGVTATINLNGKTLNRGLKNVLWHGYVIKVEGTLTITGSGTVTGGYSEVDAGGVYVEGGTLYLNGGTISGNVTEAYGGGVCVYGGTVTMSDGAAISNNKAIAEYGCGGGVYVSSSSYYDDEKDVDVDVPGIFRMTGGTISKNSANSVGGGICFEGDTFTMSGGTVSQNTAASGGGIYGCGGSVSISGSAAITGNTASGAGDYDVGHGGGLYLLRNENSETNLLTMSGGSISNNTAARDGGGMYLSFFAVNMTGGSVSSNTASRDGGGIFNCGTVDLSGTAAVSGNTASKNGGGIYNADSEVNMSGGSITGNTASGTVTPDDEYDFSGRGGGGVCNRGTFNMSGGTITANAAADGGGVYNNGSMGCKGELNVSGTAAIRDNKKTDKTTPTNVLSVDCGLIGVTAALSGDIYVDVNDDGSVVAEGRNGYRPVRADAEHFHSTGNSALKGVLYGNSVALKNIDTDAWLSLQKQLNEGGTVTLNEDAIAGDGDPCLVVPNGVTVTLDLNGHSVNRNLPEAIENGCVIQVESGGALTLTDGSEEKRGAVTGGRSTGSGGGILVEGTLTMSGGTVTGNSAKSGAGVSVEKDGSFIVSGGASVMDGLALNENLVKISGALSGVFICESAGGATVARGEGFHFPTARDAARFRTADGACFGLINNNNGRVRLAAVSTWAQLQAELEVKNTVTLTHNITCDDQTLGPLVVAHETARIDLNGHVIDRGLKTKDALEDGCALLVSRGCTLTLCDGSEGKNGAITGGNNVGNGGGIHVEGTLTMNGGTIRGNRAANGGGVFGANGGIEIAGGAIRDNTATGDGGGVFSSQSSIQLTAGVISGNRAAGSGGGVYSGFSLDLSGGSVTLNTAGSAGGGVYTVGYFWLSGDPSVKGNTCGGSANNLQLKEDTVGIVSEALTGGVGSIGVTHGDGVFAKSLPEYAHDAITEEEITCFFSDDPNYVVCLENGEAALRRNLSVTRSGEKLVCGVKAPPAGAKLIAVRYDNGQMTDVQIADAGSVTFTMKGSGDSYKVMLVDGTSFAPLCAAWQG